MRFLQHKSSIAKRGLSVLCVLALCLGLMPTAAFAGTDTGKAIQLVDSGTAANIGGGQADNIYFGTYQQSNAGSTEPDGTEGVDWIKSDTATKQGQGPYYYIEPVKWRVLSNENGQLFLLSDQNLDVFQYHTDWESVTWETSTMRSWLNGYGASANTGGDSGTDYTNDNFIDTAFSSGEQGAIAQTYVYNATQSDRSSNPNPSYGTSGGENTTDKIFLLSIEEANNSSYFPNGNDSRISTNTAYVAGGGKIGGNVYGVGEADYWWLRSPGTSDNFAASVPNLGSVSSYGAYVDDARHAVRPAFHLDLKSVLFTSAAVGGKSASGMDSGLTAVDDYDGNEWKLTLLDSSRSFAVTEDTASGNPGETITLNYTGATIGTNEYISAIIADKSGAQYYGRVAQPTEASGTVSIKIPDTLADGTYTLNVFSEQYNGDYKTDYASAFAAVSLTIDTTAPTLSGGSATRTSETAATVKFTSDEAGEYFYEVVESGTTAPTINTAGTGTSCVSGENTISLDDLSSKSAKDIYIVAKDAVGNVRQPLKITIPAISTLTVELNGGSGSTTSGKYPEGKEIHIDAGSKAGYRFAGWTSSNGGTFADASSASTTFTMPAADTTITANWTEAPSGPTTYQVVIDSDITGGTVTASPRWAARGDTVFLTATADEGYELSALSVSDRNGEAITLDNEGGGVYSFTMPVGRVTVTAAFSKAVITLPFTDVHPGDWFYEPVCFVYSQGLMTGTSATTFEPNTSLSRAMIVAVLHRLEGSPAVSGGHFSDVAEGDWYAQAVNWAASVGVVNGFEDGTFQPNAAITREQLAAILCNFAAYKGMDVSTSGDLSTYSDAASVSDWAKESMQWAVEQGLISGMTVDTLQPQGLSTRAQVAAVLQRYLAN